MDAYLPEEEGRGSLLWVPDGSSRTVLAILLHHCKLVGWCFEPSQPQRITSGLTASLECIQVPILWLTVGAPTFFAES